MVELEPLAGAGVGDLHRPCSPPLGHRVRRPPLDARDGGPGDERLAPGSRSRRTGRRRPHPASARPSRSRTAAATPSSPRPSAPTTVPRSCSSAEKVSSLEALGPDELPAVVHAAAAEVERDRRESGPSQPLGERGEHAPVLEPLEAVNHDDRRPGRVPAAGADVDQELAEGAGEPVVGEGRSGHPMEYNGRRAQLTAGSSSSSSPASASSRARTPSGRVHWSSMWPTGKP